MQSMMGMQSKTIFCFILLWFSAPGEEAFLWKEIKKRLDKKLEDNEETNKNDKPHFVNQDGTTESEKKTALANSL